jgi:hypothetical protein
MALMSIWVIPTEGRRSGASVSKILCGNDCVEYKMNSLMRQLPGALNLVVILKLLDYPRSHKFFKHSDASMISARRLLSGLKSFLVLLKSLTFCRHCRYRERTESIEIDPGPQSPYHAQLKANIDSDHGRLAGIAVQIWVGGASRLNPSCSNAT